MGPITTGASKGNRGPIVTDCQSPVTDHASHAYRMVAFGAYQEDGTASSLKARDYKNATDLFVAGTLGRRGLRSHTEIDGHGAYIPVSFAKTHKPVSDTDAEIWTSVDASPTITHWHRDRSDIGTNVAVTQPMSVRRLTPRECERLQGFPDDYTAITYRNKPAADGPRYKALGNSMAVPVMRWIGERINAQEVR